MQKSEVINDDDGYDDNYVYHYHFYYQYQYRNAQNQT